MRLIDPGDEEGLAAFAAVLEASDKEMWPDLCGYQRIDISAFARFRGKSRRWELLAAYEGGGTAPVLGIGLMEFPMLENPHSSEITLAVHPEHRRRGVGTAIVEKMGERAVADGRRALNTIVDVPLTRVHDDSVARVRDGCGFRVDADGQLAPPLSPSGRRAVGRPPPGRCGRSGRR